MASTATSSSPAAAPAKQETPTARKKPPKPYSAWWNPNLRWIDLLICWIGTWFFPAKQIAAEGQECNAKYRPSFDKSTKLVFKQSCKKWSRECGDNDGLAMCTWKVPRRPEILYEWNAIIDKNDALMKQVIEQSSKDKDDYVIVRVLCPASLVLKDGDDRTVNDCGCIEVDNVDLCNISQDVPVILWFHGGGLTLGRCDFGWENHVPALLEAQKQVTGSEAVPPLVLASVDYRLAPEHPLPAASIDALSVVDFCLKNDPKRKIHISGESAGGYLSVVSAFAGHKQYPGRIKSALNIVPFLSPAADSMSYYMNGPSSVMVNVGWLRWCWRVSLEMENEVNGENDDDVLAVGSNRTAWNKSKWKQNEQWHKFLEPLEGIPTGLDKKENGIKYIVGVNKADPLYDEGRELANKLEEAGADVDYIEAEGSHSIGFTVHRKAKAEMIEKWRVAVFEK